jgi:hypothetical protein
MRNRLGGAHPRCAQGREPVGFSGKGVAVSVFIRLEKARSAADGYAVAVVDTAARDTSRSFDLKLSPK